MPQLAKRFRIKPIPEVENLCRISKDLYNQSPMSSPVRIKHPQKNYAVCNPNKGQQITEAFPVMDKVHTESVSPLR